MDNEKLKVYLDTSVISHLYQLDASEKMAETLACGKSSKLIILMFVYHI